MSTDGAAERRDAAERLVGTVVASKYRIDRLLGSGGMGSVYQATNLAIGKRVALKFLHHEAKGDAEAIRRFQREALAASVVESAHIVHIFDSGSSETGLPFLVMELLQGEDLRCRLRREGRLPLNEAVVLTGQILRALARAHEAGIVHRDLKPENVFLCQRDDASLFVKIVDFGISKLSGVSAVDTLTRQGAVLGTAHYMSPEQAQAYSDIDGRTDLFSVGAILFECLTGRPPHLAPTYEAVLIALCTREAADVRTLLPEAPEALARVLGTALARNRSERFANASAMLEALRAAVPEAFSTSLHAVSSAPRSMLKPATPKRLADRESTVAWPGASRVRSIRAGPRTSVLAVAATLAGFGLTALWVRYKAEALPPTEAPLQSLESVAPPRAPEAIAAPTLRSPVVSTASAAASLTSTPSATPSASGLAAPMPRPRKADTRSKSRGAGIAQGLELSTKEP